MTYYPEHKGHSFDISHIRLRREQREVIAEKLAAGIPFDYVLDSVHSSAPSSSINKLHFLRKQDLLNIAREFGIQRDEVQYKNDENEHIPDVSVVSPNSPPVLTEVCKSDAIMCEVSSRWPSRNINQLISNAELAWANIRAAMEDNLVVAQVVWEHMSRLRSLVAALGHEAESPRLPLQPPSNEPVKKLATTQRSLRSTRKHTPTKREITTSKPSMEENGFLLKTLGGDEPVISHLPSTDHDPSNLAAHVINFEHSYTRP